MSSKVLFVDVPAVSAAVFHAAETTRTDISYSFGMPLGILYLSSYLKKHCPSAKVALIDYPDRIPDFLSFAGLDDFIVSVAKEASPEAPDILAFSALFSSCHSFLVRSIQLLKALWPTATVILGGMHPSNCVQDLLKIPEVDFVANGEGELAFLDFFRAHATPAMYQIKGIHHRSHDLSGTLAQCTAPENLDDLPFPDWELIDMESYITVKNRSVIRSGENEMEKKTAIIMTTRGCPFKCTFCSSHSVHGRVMRFRSIANVIDEVQQLYERYNVTRIIPEDDLFTANRKWVIDLLDAIAAIGIPNLEIQFPNALSIATLKDDVMDALIRTGMKLATVAIESGSPHTQKHIIKKNVNLDLARHVTSYLLERGIIVRSNFVIGFPGETRDLIEETFNYARSLGLDWCSFGIAMPLVGSEMYDQMVALGYIADGPESWENTNYSTRVFDTVEISGLELTALIYRRNLEINFVGNPNLVKGRFDRAIEVFTDIAVKYPFHIFAWHGIAQAHKGLGNDAEAERILAKIYELVRTDSRAAELLVTHGDLIPEISSVHRQASQKTGSA